MSKIIGIMGKAGSGKSHVCSLLQAEYNFVELNFADPLKRMLLKGFPNLFSFDDLWGPSENRNRKIPYFNQTIRQILQTLGTEWGRDTINKDLWTIYGVSLALSLVEKPSKYNYNKETGLKKVYDDGSRANRSKNGVVIGDVRFENEATKIREVGGIIVKVVMEGLTPIDNHVSEIEMDHIVPTFTIYNKIGESLKPQLDRIVNYVKPVLRHDY